MAGRLHGAGEEAAVEQVQDRVLDAADVLVDRQPGDRPPCGRSAPSSIHGSVKRAKYQDESTNVSMVSVSRRAGLAALRAVRRVFQVGWRSSGLPGLSKVDVVRQLHRQVLSGTGTTPQASQWMIGIGQPQ